MDGHHHAAAPSVSEPPRASYERRRFTVTEVLAMQDAGLLEPKGHELIDGDICRMAAKKNDHEITKNGLLELLIERLGRRFRIAVESTLFLAEDSAPEPDIMIYARKLKPEEVRGPDVLLAIEIAEESLARDLGRKAEIYAAAGVSEYWVVEAASRRCHVHRLPLPDGVWRERRIVERSETLSPAFDATLSLTLAEL